MPMYINLLVSCVCVHVQTIFEIHSTTRSVGKQVMKKKRYDLIALQWCSCDSHVIALLCTYREYHSGVVTAKREKQNQLKMEDYASRTGTNQELSTTDDLAGFQTEHSAKPTATSGKGIWQS